MNLFYIVHVNRERGVESELFKKVATPLPHDTQTHLLESLGYKAASVFPL